MANNVSSTNLTGLYGSTGNTVTVATSNVPVVNNSVASKNLTTLYSGSPTIIPSSGGNGGGANVAILDEGVLLTQTVTSINFVGNDVVANNTGNAVTVTINTSGGNANYANFAGDVVNSSQPNITSVGILTGLVVDGDITPNINITYSLGNATNRFNNLYLSGNTIILGDQQISANANGTIFTGNIYTDNNITALKFYAATDGPEFGGYGFVGATNNNTAMCLSATNQITIFNNAAGTLTLYANNNSKFIGNVEATLFIGDGGSLSNITDANHANVADSANSVYVGNVSGIGNIATINLDGNVSNILAGDGTFVAIPTVSSNANYANFAGDVVNSSQPNITSVGTLIEVNTSGVLKFVGNSNAEIQQDYGNGSTTLTIRGGSGASLLKLDGLADARVEAYANVIIKSNSQAAVIEWNFDTTGNLTLPGNVFAINYANGTQVPLDGDVANANYANFAGTVITNAQPNITSVGNLINLRVENANVHLGTNAGLGNIGINIIAIGNNSASSNYVTSTNFVSWDGVTAILGVTDTTGIFRGYTVSGTGFTLGQTVNSVIDSGNLQMNDVADGTPSGVMTFSSAQGNNSVAIGYNAGRTTQNANSVAIGNAAGSIGQFSLAVAVGSQAGESNQGAGAVAIGGLAGNNTQGGNSVAIGVSAGSNTQGDRAVAIGAYAGNNTQGTTAVAVGFYAGNDTQGVYAVAVGRYAGYTLQGGNAVAVGSMAGYISQGGSAVAVGNNAGLNSQGISSVAIGNRAGRISQGSNSIAIGSQAGYSSQANNSIILNATGSNLNQTTANTFTVKPVRQANTSNVMFYNTTSGEISYDVIGNIATVNLDGNVSNLLTGSGTFVAIPTVSSNANYANFAGTVITNAQPNITSLGTLTNVSVSGNANIGTANITNANITTANITTGNIGNLQLQKFQETVYNYGNATGTITPDFNNGSIQKLTLTGNITMNSLGNAIAGRSMTLILTQDATAGRILTSSMLFSDGYDILSTASGAKDIISVFYDGTSYYAVLSKGYA